MNRVLVIVAVGLAGVFFGAVVCFVSLLVWQSYDESRALDVTAEECEPEDAEGAQVCVQRREGRPGVLGGAQVDYLYFVHRVDGEDIPRVTYAAYPFHEDGLTVTFGRGQIVVHGDDGAEAVFPDAFYALH